ncbi:acyltransferase [Actinoplanes bogorensis]|uniref:Acyltransferase n=1 Tax=Paractinoplanes bogorensis TaxID=1610840 RepID=A0ABS5YMH8_9ACTN|nr:acyltransferase [Actinoplanes bogorensis]MBU2664583.1 acyltransferase [Actinoplanes bogorensis]
MAEPRVRDRYFDLLRVLAIVRVSVFHMFPYALLELAFPSMGVMFALAGSLMAGSLARSGIPQVLYGRIRRLLPAYWVLAVLVVPVMFLEGWDERPPLWHLLTWIVPFADPPSSGLGEQAAEVLWYLVTYLWLVLLSPVLLWLYRRARLVTILVPLVLLAMSARFTIPSEATDVLMYASCWLVGFAHRDGSLRRVPAWLVTLAAVTAAGGALAYAHVTPGTLQDLPFPYAVYQLAFVLVLLRWSPRITWSPALFSLINARAVTVYLWNNVAIALCFPVGDVFEAWRLGQAGYAVIALVLLANAVLLLGWVEDLSARRRPRFLPWPVPPRGSTKLSVVVAG